MPSQMVDPKSIQAIPEEKEVEERVKVETTTEAANGDPGEGHVRMTVQGDGGGSDNMQGVVVAMADSDPVVDFMEVPGAVTNGLPETIKEEDEEDVSEHR